MVGTLKNIGFRSSPLARRRADAARIGCRCGAAVAWFLYSTHVVGGPSQPAYHPTLPGSGRGGTHDGSVPDSTSGSAVRQERQTRSTNSTAAAGAKHARLAAALPPNVRGLPRLVTGGFIFTATSAMIRLCRRQIESVQTAFFRAALSVVMLLPIIAAGKGPWQSKRLAGHFWRTSWARYRWCWALLPCRCCRWPTPLPSPSRSPLFSVVVAALVAGEGALAALERHRRRLRRRAGNGAAG